MSLHQFWSVRAPQSYETLLQFEDHSDRARYSYGGRMVHISAQPMHEVVKTLQTGLVAEAYE
jgi:hypothetical protein